MTQAVTTDMILRPTPGEGLLARAGDLVLLCSSVQDERAEQLLGQLDRVAAEDGDGRRLVRALTGALFGMDAPPALVAYGPTGNGQALLVRGAATAVARTADGEARLDGTEAVTWVDRVLHGAIAITASLGANPMGAVSTSVRLDDGVVPAGGFALTDDDASAPVAALPEPAAAAEPGVQARQDAATSRSTASFRPLGRAPVAVPDESAAEETGRHAAPASTEQVYEQPVERPAEPLPEPIAAEAPVPSAPDAPPSASEAPAHVPAPEAPPQAAGEGSRAQVGPHTMSEVADEGEDAEESAIEVLGIYCKNEHFNHPESRFCAVCGISMVQATHVPKPGRRPPLGVLVLDDGQTFRLDTTYIIGREPERNQEVLRGHATPVRVNDPEALVSRAHAMVTLDGWNVQVVDLESANGTHVLAPGATGWLRLQPSLRQTIAAGTRIAIGQRGFLYESHRKV